MRYIFLVIFFISSLFAEELLTEKQAKIKDTPAARVNQILKEKEKQDALHVEEEEEFGDLDEFDDEFAEHDKEVEEIFDPLYPYNNWMTGVNHSLMLNVVEPVSDGYGFIVPAQGRTCINNFFKNISYPISLVNNILQLEVVDTYTETMRFLINSTLGLLGFFDPAAAWFDIQPQVEDFGQTLGSYGVGSGFPVVLPFFGQKNLRDLGGNFVDTYANPVFYVEDRFYNTVEHDWQSVIITGYEDFNEYSLTPGAYPKLTEDAVDLYPFLRDAYEQHRKQLIKE